MLFIEFSKFWLFWFLFIIFSILLFNVFVLINESSSIWIFKGRDVKSIFKSLLFFLLSELSLGESLCSVISFVLFFKFVISSWFLFDPGCIQHYFLIEVFYKFCILLNLRYFPFFLWIFLYFFISNIINIYLFILIFYWNYQLK